MSARSQIPEGFEIIEEEAKGPAYLLPPGFEIIDREKEEREAFARPTTGELGSIARGQRARPTPENGPLGMAGQILKRLAKPITKDLSERKGGILQQALGTAEARPEAREVLRSPKALAGVATAGLVDPLERIGRIPFKGIKGIFETPGAESLRNFFYKDLSPEGREGAERAEHAMDVLLPVLPKAIKPVLRGTKGLVKKIPKRPPKGKLPEVPKAIMESIIEGNPDIPISSFETVGEALKVLQEGKASSIQEAIAQALRDQPQRGAGRPLAGRVAEGIPAGREIPIRPVPTRIPGRGEALPDFVSRTISPTEITNTTQGGTRLQNTIRGVNETVYGGVNDLYEISRELNEGIETIHPRLVDQMKTMLTRKERIGKKSGVTINLIDALEKNIDLLAKFSPDGTVVGYKPISNQVLIDQIQELRKIIDFDFLEGKPKNIFRTLINDIQDSVMRAANQVNPTAANAFREARTAYREWSEAFDNKYINPYRDLSNRDFSKLFKGSTDIDNFGVINDVLQATPEGQALSNEVRREIVNKNIGKFLADPKASELRSFEREMRELAPILNPQEDQAIRRAFGNETRRVTRRVTKKAIEQAAKYTKRTPEDLQKMMNNRSGIRELRQDMSHTSAQRRAFKRVEESKIRDILHGDRVKKDYTGTKLYDLLNERKNYELLTEMTSAEEVNALLDVSEKIGKQSVTRKNIKRFAKRTVKTFAKYKILKVLFTLPL